MHIRVVSYNIHKCIGRDGKYDPARVAATIAEQGPDLVMLQEVDEGAKRSQLHRQVDTLGDLLGFAFRAYAQNVFLRSGGGYGNAILSRWPIVTSANIDLTTRFKKARSVLHAELALPGGRTLHALNAHLGLAQYERKIQLGNIVGCYPLASATPETPVILGGDFNDVYATLKKRLLPHGFMTIPGPATFPSGFPLRPLDSMYVRGPVALEALTTPDSPNAKIASDHRPLVGVCVLTSQETW